MSKPTTIGDAAKTVPLQEGHEPAPIGQPTESNEERHDRMCRRLIVAGFPERQVRAPGRSLQGELWLAKGREIVGRIGTGFLIGLIGESGTGKTQMAAAIAMRVALSRKEAQYVKSLRFFLELRETMNKARGDARESELQVIERLCRPDLLVIDEASERGETDWEDRMLAYLIDERYAAKKDTLLIANQKKEAFIAGVGPRVANRLKETGGIIVCAWPSYRGR